MEQIAAHTKPMTTELPNGKGISTACSIFFCLVIVPARLVYRDAHCIIARHKMSREDLRLQGAIAVRHRITNAMLSR